MTKLAPAPPIEAKRRVRVTVVDDHFLMREGIISMLKTQPEFEVIATAGDAVSGLAMILETKPDIAIVDITLPGRNGLELIKDVLAHQPRLPILVLSMHDEALYAERALKAGARGYLMKDSSPPMILEALRRILGGGFAVSDRMSSEILATLAGKAAGKSDSGGPVTKLSDREFEIFEHLGSGLSTQEIASRLCISPKTVDVHRARIREKLSLPTGAALVRYAVRWVETRNLGN